MILLSTGAIVGIVIAVIVVVLVVCIAKCYNKLVDLRNKVKNAFSQIDVQLKRRFDLIPNLVETVKGYATHEREIWDQFASARGSYIKASQDGNIEGMGQATGQLSSALSRLLLVQERYPELKANSNFQSLMAQLDETEDKISVTRQIYNDVVLKYNNYVEKFPSNIIASMFKFNTSAFFEITDVKEKEAPMVSF